MTKLTPLLYILALGNCNWYLESDQHKDFSSTRIMNRCMAEKAIKAAISKSEELNVNMNIAVVDLGANLVSFTRMDDAWLGSVDIAMKKAKTAVMFNMNTGNIGTLPSQVGPCTTSSTPTTG